MISLEIGKGGPDSQVLEEFVSGVCAAIEASSRVGDDGAAGGAGENGA